MRARSRARWRRPGLWVPGLAVVLLVWVWPAWAGAFDPVPTGHWAYGACRGLVELGLLPAEQGASFSGEQQLTRFEFALSILGPLADIDRAVASLPAGAEPAAVRTAVARALDVHPSNSEEDVARGASDLARLGQEFSEALRSLGFDPSEAVRALKGLNARAVQRWRAEALSPPTAGAGLAPGPPAGEGLRVPFARGTLALTYDRSLWAPRLLDLFAASAAEGSGTGERLSLGEPALRDPLVSRVRTAYEYGLGSALTLSLAYEEIARRGQGLAPLDTASLASFGIGYRLTPSASVKLSYSLLEYSNHIFDSDPLYDRLAETSVSITF